DMIGANRHRRLALFAAGLAMSSVAMVGCSHARGERASSTGAVGDTTAAVDTGIAGSAATGTNPAATPYSSTSRSSAVPNTETTTTAPTSGRHRAGRSRVNYGATAYEPASTTSSSDLPGNRGSQPGSRTDTSI